ncbi:hypothetical protein CEXT_464821 [Caerostris extrusa]|uniref:Secreted protein n=1 Tax=Caerostris extrusa TaxID=172846 RepID=A0AAV4XUI2_CAEEX|nr:hypothetical protein CEXT_464821 [Caerostris extrusa]
MLFSILAWKAHKHVFLEFHFCLFWFLCTALHFETQLLSLKIRSIIRSILDLFLDFQLLCVVSDMSKSLVDPFKKHHLGHNRNSLGIKCGGFNVLISTRVTRQRVVLLLHE